MAAARARHVPGVPAAPRARRCAAQIPASRAGAVTALQRSAGNRAVASAVQRDAGGAGGLPLHPGRYPSFGSWLAALPGGAVDAKAFDVTDEVGRELPHLKELVVDLRADCADVTIILKHYYFAFHGKTISIPSRDDDDRSRRTTYEIGHGVSKEQLRKVTSNLGTIHFQDMRKLDRIVTYYGGARPLRNLRQILRAGLKAGDVLVWKKKAGVKGRFSGHIQTVQHVWITMSGDSVAYEIDVLQGTLENEKAKGQLQSKKLTGLLLTGDPAGDGPIIYEPAGEEVFYGAGEWKEERG